MELVFTVEKTPDGHYTAHAFEAHIVVEADSWDELQARIQDAVNEAFPGEVGPEIIRFDVLEGP